MKLFSSTRYQLLDVSGSAPIIVTPISSPTSSSSGSSCESPELPHLPCHKYPQPPPIFSRDSGDSLEDSGLGYYHFDGPSDDDWHHKEDDLLSVTF